MLSPPVIRAGVARQKSSNSPVPPNRRSASSSSRIAPLQLPPINNSPSSPHSRNTSRHAMPPPVDVSQPSLSASLSSSPTSSYERAAAASISQYAPSTQLTSPPSRAGQLDFLSTGKPSSASRIYDAPSPASAGPSSAGNASSDMPTEQHAWWLTFRSSYHESQFRLFMRLQSDTRMAAIVFAVLYTGALINHCLHYSESPSLMLQRLVLLLGSLLLTTVMLVWSHIDRRYETTRQLVMLAISVCASSLWILAFGIHANALSTSPVPAGLILFDVAWLVVGRPLLFPYAVVQLLISCVLFTAVACADPPSFITAALLFFFCLCVWLHSAVLAEYLRRMDAASRAHYCNSLSIHLLHAHNAQLTSDTRQLKSDFFVLTLERFDIADVEEEGKVLSSAMEQAMGKLQALGKNQQLPPAVLKEIMAVISLLGSGSDLFKAKMEHTSLAGEDDEMTRYIYETLNGEHNRNSSTPTQRSLTYMPKQAQPSSDLTTITEAGSAAMMGIEVASEVDRSLSGLLAQLEDWNLDLFEVSNMTAGRPLYFIGMALLKRYNCLAEFNLDPVKLSNYMREMEAGYGTTNPYHNSIHAADVARSVHYFIQCGRLEQYCSKLEIFTLIIASLAHDFQHPGKNNAYLISVRDERALIYNDRSVLENFHTAQMFHLLLNGSSSSSSSASSSSQSMSSSSSMGGSFQQSNCNFLSHLPHKDFLQFRKLMVELVLATDLAHSNEFLGRFKNWYVNGSTTSAAAAAAAAGGTAGGATLGASVGGAAGGGTGESVVSVAGGVVGFQSTAVTVLDNEARLMVMKMALKCADIGHSAKRLALHEKWTARITEEFYRQGDEERKQALPISPFMDRRKANLSQSQTGFIDYVCQPLYGAWFKFLDPDEKRQRDMHDERLRLLKGEWERGGVAVVGDELAAAVGGGRGRSGSGDGGGAEVGSEFEWVRKRTASQMRMDEEQVSVLEQLKRNREHWKTWQGPSAKT